MISKDKQGRTRKSKDKERKAKKNKGNSRKAKKSEENSTVGTARKMKENHRTTTGKAIRNIGKAGKTIGPSQENHRKSKNHRTNQEKP